MVLVTEPGFSLIIPAYNEEKGIAAVIDEAKQVLAEAGVAHEIIVVDDCSADRTAEIAEAAGTAVLRNVQNGGYGYSLMRGIRAARFSAIAIVDADGSYPLDVLPELIARYREGFAMVVGQRQGAHYVGSLRVRILRALFRGLAAFIVGRSVPDVNSGMRIFDRDAVLPFLAHLSYGFSFTTSITLLFMMRALPVTYVRISYLKRQGASKVRYFRDALRALQIIAQVTLRLNPIKLFLMMAGLNLLFLPVAWWLSPTSSVLAIVTALIVQTSVVITGLGFVIEGLVDKLQFTRDLDEVNE